jgi:hypothetical protein
MLPAGAETPPWGSSWQIFFRIYPVSAGRSRTRVPDPIASFAAPAAPSAACFRAPHVRLPSATAAAAAGLGMQTDARQVVQSSDAARRAECFASGKMRIHTEGGLTATFPRVPWRPMRRPGAAADTTRTRGCFETAKHGEGSGMPLLRKTRIQTEGAVFRPRLRVPWRPMRRPGAAADTTRTRGCFARAKHDEGSGVPRSWKMRIHTEDAVFRHVSPGSVETDAADLERVRHEQDARLVSRRRNTVRERSASLPKNADTNRGRRRSATFPQVPRRPMRRTAQPGITLRSRSTWPSESSARQGNGCSPHQ